ncbi:MAG: MFS transporter [Gemmatimonadaceae bacterium]
MAVAGGGSPDVAPDPPLRVKLIWVAALYFASGLPFGVANMLVPAFLRSEGAALEFIGRIISGIGLAWTLKFLWSPLVDRFGSRKSWIVPGQLAIAGITLFLIAADPRGAPLYLWVVLGLLATASATQDIAVDAYTIELMGARELGVASGVRATGYRVGLIVASGALVALAGPLGWSASFAVAAAIMVGAAIVTASAPRRARLHRAQPLLEPARALLAMPSLWVVVMFVLAFKIGDLAMQAMVVPFWVDRGLTQAQMGLIGTLSIGAAVCGALLGGVLTTRWGVYRSLWTLGLLQALSNLGYFAAARAGVPAEAVYAAAVIEQFTGGLGTAAFLAFLMSLCEKRYAATQYAVLSALFGLSRLIAGYWSGTLVEAIGYAGYFLLTFGFALPAFALVPLLRSVLERRGAQLSVA